MNTNKRLFARRTFMMLKINMNPFNRTQIMHEEITLLSA
jgi:hypothetical protein